MRQRDGVLDFAPRLPEKLERLAFTLQVLGRCLHVEITDSQTAYILVEGEPLDIRHFGQPLTVSGKSPQTRPTPAVITRPAPEQPPGRVPRRR
jgi:alpha,alpha-trehalose phosphorylase